MGTSISTCLISVNKLSQGDLGEQHIRSVRTASVLHCKGQTTRTSLSLYGGTKSYGLQAFVANTETNQITVNRYYNILFSLTLVQMWLCFTLGKHIFLHLKQC